uniref:Secreted protein n=1 Tax=Steinernema glaseri TaxID=37863 RepID=A0A1I8AV08_9BILA
MKFLFLIFAFATYGAANQNDPAFPQGAVMAIGAPTMHYFPGALPQQTPQPMTQRVCATQATFVMHRVVKSPLKLTKNCGEVATSDAGACTSCCRIATLIPATNVHADEIEGFLIGQGSGREITDEYDYEYESAHCLCCFHDRVVAAPYDPYAQPFNQPQFQQLYPSAYHMGR